MSDDKNRQPKAATGFITPARWSKSRCCDRPLLILGKDELGHDAYLCPGCRTTYLFKRDA